MALSGTLLPRLPLRPGRADPLIQEARERGRRRRRRNAALLLVLASGVAAFSIHGWTGDGRTGLAGSKAPAATGPVPNPCLLLTNAEAARAVGQKVVYRTGQNSPAEHLCQWNFPVFGDFTSAHAIVSVYVSRSTRADFEARRPSGVESVPGLGQLAYWRSPGADQVPGAVQMLQVWDRGYDLVIVPATVEAPLHVAKLVAASALPRL